MDTCIIKFSLLPKYVYFAIRKLLRKKINLMCTQWGEHEMGRFMQMKRRVVEPNGHFPGSSEVTH